MSLRRTLPFILINIVVSAIVVLGILFWWDKRNPAQEIVVTATVEAVSLPTAAAGSISAVETAETPEPEKVEQRHTVSPGDTLGNISQFYDVPLDDIMAANGLTNPNLLSVGQELIIPAGPVTEAVVAEVPEEAEAPEPTLEALPSPIPTDAPLAEGEAIVQISAVTGVGELTEEAVQISNSGNRQIALQGWTLTDANGRVFSFGQVTLFGDGAAVTIHTEKGQNDAADLYWGLESPIWESGERVTLLDKEGNIAATFDIP